VAKHKGGETCVGNHMRDEMYDYGRGGIVLMRGLLVIRVMGRLPWLHLLPLVSDVGQCRLLDEQTALSTGDTLLSSELQASPHRVT
jgi:hypothetical protein